MVEYGVEFKSTGWGAGSTPYYYVTQGRLFNLSVPRYLNL